MLHVLLDIAQFADLSNPRKVTLWIFKEETKRKAIFFPPFLLESLWTERQSFITEILSYELYFSLLKDCGTAMIG